MPVTSIPIIKQELRYVVVTPDTSDEDARNELMHTVQQHHQRDGWVVEDVDYFSRQPDTEYGNSHRCYGRVTLRKNVTVLNRTFG